MVDGLENKRRRSGGRLSIAVQSLLWFSKQPAWQGELFHYSELHMFFLKKPAAIERDILLFQHGGM